jgi:hypothetical protein
MILAFELRFLCLHKRHSTTGAKPTIIFCFSYFSHMVSYFSPELASNYDPPTYASCIAGITGMHSHTQLKIQNLLRQPRIRGSSGLRET